MKYTLLAIALLFSFHLSAQDQDAALQSKIDALSLKIEQSQNGERLKWMDSLTKVVSNNVELKYDSIVRQTISLAIKLDSLNLATLRVTDLIRFQNNYLRKPKEALKLFNTHIEKLSNTENFKSIGYLNLNAADSYYYDGNFDKSFEYYDIAKDYALKAKDEKLYALAVMFTGYNESDLGKFAEASKSLKEASQIFIKLKDTSNILAAKNSLGILYSRNAFYNEAEKERNESILLIGKTERYMALTKIYINAAEDNKRIGDIAKQLVNIKASFVANNKLEIASFHKSTILAQLVTAYAINDSITMAEKYFKDLNALYENNKTPELEIEVLRAKRELSFAKKDFKKALIYSMELLTLLQSKSSSSDDLMMAEKYVAKAYIEIGDRINHNKHLLNYYTFKDSISSVQNVKALAYYQTLYETEKRDLEIIKQDSEIKQLESDKVIESGKKNTRYTILISALLLMAGVAYYLLDRAKRKRKIIAEQLMRSKKELNDFTKQLLVKSKEQDVLKKEFNSLKSLYGEKEELVELQELADSKILTNEDWDDFKLKFKSVYAHFFINFKNQGFKFSDSEERLVALEKLSLKTNEIANMLGISPDSVHTARYRLRKKLNIPKNVDIIEFLNL
jgi:DNA-binding CsgD family transcriptional regulator